ncbi:MAG: S-layer homology domain-containing protein [Oscillospiraceae bacterium]|nr:S-layer homology domain-containing protein [Oscillospiraceae bacterium]
MKKRALSIILAIVLTFSLSVPVFATTYSDLTNHWAKSYMEDLASKGILSGYSDNTMKPDNKITTCETLALLSRLYTLTDTETLMIQADYEATVKGLVSPTLSWAYKNLEVCLASGIITLDELKSISLTGDTTKEKISLFIVRALQLSSEASKLTSDDLKFTDVSKISSNCVGAVAELYTLGVVKGDDSNSFAPQTSVTRAVAATLVSRSLEYLSKSNTKLVIEAYDGTTRDTGIITAVNGSELQVCGYDGFTKVYSVSSDAEITVNKTAKALSASYVGCYVTVTVKNGVVLILSIDSDTTTKWIQGAVSSVYVSTTANTLYLKDLKTGTISSFTVPSTATITRAGTSVLLSSIAANDFVTLKIVNSTISAIYIAPASSQISGTVASITYGTTVSLIITDSSGIGYSFPLDIANLPTLKRGDKDISIDQLKIGNTVTVVFAGSKVASIVAAGTGGTVNGVLTSFTTSATGTVWVLTVNGTKITYAVDDYVSVYNGTTALSLSDIHIGDQVSVIVYDNTITDISLVSTTASSTKVTGTVLKVDSINQVVMILTSSNKLINVKTSAVVSMILASTGSYTSLSYLVVNSKLTAYGAYSDSKTFAAKSIIIE